MPFQLPDFAKPPGDGIWSDDAQAVKAMVLKNRRPRISEQQLHPLPFTADTVLQCEFHFKLEYGFELAGHVGVANCLYEHAEERADETKKAAEDRNKALRAQKKPVTNPAKARKDYLYIEDDFMATDRNLIVMMGTIHPRIMDSLIRGNMPFQYKNDETFQTLVDKFCVPRSRPGCYVQYICRKDTGKGFTISEYRKLTKQLKKYAGNDVKMPKDKDELRFIELIDNVRPTGQSVKDKTKKRFCPKEGDRQAIIEWCNWVQENIVDPAEAASLDKNEQLMRVHSECGWAGIVSNRLAQQSALVGSNILFGLMLSIVDILLPDEFEIFARQIIFVLDNVARVTQMSEVALTLISSAYIYLGGLNPYPAGFTATFNDNQITQRWVEWNRKWIGSTGVLEINKQDVDGKLALAKYYKDRVNIRDQIEKAADQAEVQQDQRLEALLVRAKSLDLMYIIANLEAILSQVKIRDGPPEGILDTSSSVFGVPASENDSQLAETRLSAIKRESSIEVIGTPIKLESSPPLPPFPGVFRASSLVSIASELRLPIMATHSDPLTRADSEVIISDVGQYVPASRTDSGPLFDTGRDAIMLSPPEAQRVRDDSVPRASSVDLQPIAQSDLAESNDEDE